MATTVTRHDFTWVWDTDRTIGQYANGDYYVVVPSGNLNITSITPASTTLNGRIAHGTMVNPNGRGSQGYDQAMGFNTWDANLNRGRPGGSALSAGNPLSVPAGSSVCSCESRPDTSGTTSDITLYRPQLDKFAVLTVVSSAPPAGSFRPPYSGTNKTHHWNESQINYGVFPALSAPPSTPTLAAVTNLYAKTHLIHGTGDTGSSTRYSSAKSYQSSYGGSRGRNLGQVGLFLCTNAATNTQKRDVLVNLIQHGIDVYGVVAGSGGGALEEGGALNIGFKAAMVFAARCLNSSVLQAACGAQFNYFQEDRQCWRVSAGDVGRGVVSPRVTYSTADAQNTEWGGPGIPEWGEQHTRQANRDDSRWSAAYRNQNYNNNVAMALFMRLTGCRALWRGTRGDEFFDYARRVWSFQSSATQGGNLTSFSDSGFTQIESFVHQMWSTYSNAYTDYNGGADPPVEQQVSQPVLVPTARPFLASTSVTISVTNPSSGVSIYYTIDGSEPDTSSTPYSGAIPVTATTQVRARAFAADWIDSDIASATFTQRYFTATDGWTSFVTTSISASPVSVTFDFTPGSSPQDCIIGVGAIEASAYNAVACALRLVPAGDAAAGTIQARNGAAFAAANTFAYAGGTKYSAVMTVDLVAKTYDLTVAPFGGSPTTIASGYAFRTGVLTEDISTIEYFSAVTTGAATTSIENIFVNGAAPAGTVEPAAISPTHDAWLNQVEVSMTRPTSGASYRYTLDGSIPLISSTEYEAPFTRTTDTIVTAKGFLSGWTDSLVASQAYSINGYTARLDWKSININSWTIGVRVTGVLTPNFPNLDAVFGGSLGEPSDYTDLAWILRFNDVGLIDARNGSAYDAETVVSYSADVAYTFRIDVDIANKTYDAYVTPAGDTEKTIALGYAFREEQASQTIINTVSSITNNDSYILTLENLAVALGPYGIDPGATRPPIRRQSWGRRRFR